MAIKIRNVKIADKNGSFNVPTTVKVAEQITLTVIAEDVTWGTIKSDFQNWNDVKTSFSNWNEVKNYN